MRRRNTKIFTSAVFCDFVTEITFFCKYNKDKEADDMKEYVCTICGYVHKGEMPDDFKCPICGAGKEAFREVTQAATAMKTEKPQDMPDRELSPMEMSVICSNLARGCEKQYLEDERKKFEELAAFFRSKAGDAPKNGDLKKILALTEKDLDENYPYANAVAQKNADRGAMRSLVWSEKVTRMMNSVLKRYEKEGDKMLENTGVYICTVCGFLYVGDEAPQLCPVCKVPSWKFDKV